jgi:hypothetical protein
LVMTGGLDRETAPCDPVDGSKDLAGMPVDTGVNAFEGHPAQAQGRDPIDFSRDRDEAGEEHARGKGDAFARRRRPGLACPDRRGRCTARRNPSMFGITFLFHEILSRNNFLSLSKWTV